MAYATYSDVSSELGGISITGATTITSTMVDSWIADAEDEVELLSGQIYSTTAIASTVWEYHDYDGSGVIRLDKYPVQSVQLIQYEANGFGATAESWVTLEEGRLDVDNYTLYGAVGAIRLHPNSTGNAPTIGNQNIRVAYTYGHTSVPRNVKELVTKMSAKRYIEAVANKNGAKSSKSVSIGAINIDDPGNYVLNRLTQINADIERLQKQVVGKFRVVNYDLRLYG
jgi:hypothetical protein